ncbi:FxsA family membrane protein [Streptomyces sp. NRRL S-87]|uniref:FxsA family membrane protein n=1 Tax=Streptomyces sp. NRRL S-87 TaxID=1463920 RepID=UPI0004BF1A06|nr:FxsA family membrane protein [Streptomyces sp. NRRL S-87]
MMSGISSPTAPRRSRARTFLPLAVVAWAVLEIWLLTLVARAAGGFTVFALLAGGVVLGAVVIKRAGRRAFANLREGVRAAEAGPGGAPAAPGRSGGSGNGMTMLGGLLLMVPGLLSDAAGLLCLVPGVRERIAKLLGRAFQRRLATAAPGGFGSAYQQARIHYPDGKVVQGEVVREDAPAGPGGAGPFQPPRPPLTP